MDQNSERNDARTASVDARTSGLRSPASVLAICVLFDVGVTVLFLIFRTSQSSAVGWAVLMVLPLVTAVAQRSFWIRRTQVGLTVAVVAVVILGSPGTTESKVLALATVGGSLAAAAWITDRLLRQVRGHLADLRTASHTDQLTGVLNRRGLHAAYGRFAADAAAAGQPITVLTADLDGMKQVNDTHGHAVGDRALQQLTDRLTRAAPNGLVSRIGGDEHLVIVAGDAEPLVSELRNLLKGEPLAAAAGVSIGTATGPARPSADWLWTLVRKADRQLYEAKRGLPGRRTRAANRIVAIAEAPSTGRVKLQRDRSSGSNRWSQDPHLAPTREQRHLYALVVAWDAAVGAASASVQTLNGEPGTGLRLGVLLVGLTVAAGLVWWILRPDSEQSLFTGALLTAVFVLTLIALTTPEHRVSAAGLALWAPILLLASRYWPREQLLRLYGWLIFVVALRNAIAITSRPPETLMMVAAQVVAVIASAEVLYRLRTGHEHTLEQVTAHALTDPLTNVANRRGLEAAMPNFAAKPTTALVIDVDGFKEINDRDGHGAGDKALIALAQILTRHAPAQAVTARLGGDEFAIIGTEFQTPDLIARIKNAAALLPTPLTISDGTASATVGQTAESVWQLIAEADLALLDSRLASPHRQRPGTE